MRSFYVMSLISTFIVFGCGGEDKTEQEDRCDSDTDCPKGEICRDGECVVPSGSGCEKDTDCKGGRICEKNRCVYPADSEARSDDDAQAGTSGSSDGGMDAGGRETDANTGGSAGSDGVESGTSSDLTRYTLVTLEESIEIATAKSLAIYLMLDKSTSMNDLSGDTTKWSIAVNAINAFVNDVDSTSIDIALQYFPLVNPACDGSDYDTPEVPMDSLPGNASEITNSLDSVQLGNFTPIEPALRGINSFCAQFQDQYPEKTCVGVLISDGAPTQCSLDSGLLVGIAQDGYDDLGVRTFTVGMLGADFLLLNQIAIWGGTDCTPDDTSDGYVCDLTAGMTLIDALKAIREQFAETESYVANRTLDCEWGIPQPPGGPTFDRDMVNLAFSQTGSRSDERLIGRVLTRDECDRVSEGWFYDNPNRPERIIVCPDLCVTIQNSDEETVTLLYPYETVPAAGGAYCPSGFDDCDADDENGCETPLTSLTDCAACSVPCAESSCAGGECTDEICASGFADCDGESLNGCETSLETTSNCGMCDLECGPLFNAEATCQSGVCGIESCDDGFHDCDHNPVNGCESELKDNVNCGACDTPCGYANATSSCATGSCKFVECAAGFDDCNDDLDDGCEANIDYDTNHCGACDGVCRSGQKCYRGECRCGSGGEEICGIECIDALYDEQNCGGCGILCDKTCCGGECVDTETDENHCGDCSHACHSGFSCVDGECVCDSDDDCQGRTCCSGECADITSDPDNCGACENVCSEGGCCDTDTGPTCVDFKSDVTNCGGCGIICVPAVQTCCKGSCVFMGSPCT